MKRSVSAIFLLPLLLPISGCCNRLDDVTKATAAAGAEAVRESMRGKHHISGKNVATAALFSTSFGLRTLQNTDAAADPAAVRQNIKDNSSLKAAATTALANAVAQAIENAAQDNICHNKANEAAAKGLDQAATLPSATPAQPR